MPNQPDIYTSTPGSMVADKLQEILARKRDIERQAMIDALNRKNVESEITARGVTSDNDTARTGIEGRRADSEIGYRTLEGDETKARTAGLTSDTAHKNTAFDQQQAAQGQLDTATQSGSISSMTPLQQALLANRAGATQNVDNSMFGPAPHLRVLSPTGQVRDGGQINRGDQVEHLSFPPSASLPPNQPRELTGFIGTNADGSQSIPFIYGVNKDGTPNIQWSKTPDGTHLSATPNVVQSSTGHQVNKAKMPPQLQSKLADMKKRSIDGVGQAGVQNGDVAAWQQIRESTIAGYQTNDKVKYAVRQALIGDPNAANKSTDQIIEHARQNWPGTSDEFQDFEDLVRTLR